MSGPAQDLIDAVTNDDAARVAELVAGDPALAAARDRGGVSALMLSRYRFHRETTDALLGQAGVLALIVHGAEGRVVILGERAPVTAVYDLGNDNWMTLIADALGTLLHRGTRLIRVLGPSPQEMGTLVDITLPEAPMWVAMVDYSIRILNLSLILSLLVAAMLFFGLQRMIVRPLRRITGEIAAFRSRPEDGTVDQEPEPRADEIGVVEGEFVAMRAGLRGALAEKTRLAALGAGMSRIGHDLRNILATAVLISDRLEGSADPAVRRVAPRLVETLNRALRLCGETLSYARTGPPEPQPRPACPSTWRRGRPTRRSARSSGRTSTPSIRSSRGSSRSSASRSSRATSPRRRAS